MIQHSFDQWLASCPNGPRRGAARRGDEIAVRIRSVVNGSIAAKPEFWRHGLMLSLPAPARRAAGAAAVQGDPRPRDRQLGVLLAACPAGRPPASPRPAGPDLHGDGRRLVPCRSRSTATTITIGSPISSRTCWRRPAAGETGADGRHGERSPDEGRNDDPEQAADRRTGPGLSDCGEDPAAHAREHGAASGFTVEDAYAVQRRLIEIKVADGGVVKGRKIDLLAGNATCVQHSRTRLRRSSGGHVLRKRRGLMSRFIQPAECEVGFVIETSPLRAPIARFRRAECNRLRRVRRDRRRPDVPGRPADPAGAQRPRQHRRQCRRAAGDRRPAR